MLAGTRQPNSMAIIGRGSLGGGALTAGTVEAVGVVVLFGTGRRKALPPTAFCCAVGCCWPVGKAELTDRPGAVTAGVFLGLEVSKPITLGTWAIRFFSALDDEEDGAAIRCDVEECCGQDCAPLAEAVLASWKAL